MIDVIPHGDARLDLTDLYLPEAGRGVPVDPDHERPSFRRREPVRAARAPHPCSLQTKSNAMNDNRHQDDIYPFPAGMQSREIETNGAKIHVRVGGHGPTVVMLHGFGTTGDMWGHLASALIEDHMVVAPDLRGSGLSSKPDGGYGKKNQASDVVGVLDALGVRTAELVTHDIGIMVGFAVAAIHDGRVERRSLPSRPMPGQV
jgi:hypothetical protein